MSRAATPSAGSESARLPAGFEPDHHDPDKFVVRCPDCSDRDVYDERPGTGVQRCIHCGRLRGVTPVSRDESGEHDNDHDDWIDEARNAEEPVENDGEDARRCPTCSGFVADDARQCPKCEQQLIATDGGRPGPDPENLTDADKPAVIDVDGDGDVYVASAKVRENGWLWLKQWDGRTFKLPPHRIRAIQRIRTERHGEPDKMGMKPQRVADEEWRERAREMTADTEATEAVVADD
ncbi:hypothetical protein [Haloarcula laminariae]|uniref:hypothetical protein n=1 Tax=Haloarcula laminariae TaxID=2961577 RepID=UPI0021C7B9DA|nr:hypothetical protein [Halomicroarcula laminariae]